jgi:hypothetical protein
MIKEFELYKLQNRSLVAEDIKTNAGLYLLYVNCFLVLDRLKMTQVHDCAIYWELLLCIHLCLLVMGSINFIAAI